MMKRTFYTEIAYVLGIIILALGTAFMERADFGMSMVVAPAYIIHLKVSRYLAFFSFGMAEYCFQAFLLIVLSIVVFGFKKKYLFSFVTAFIYGNILDLCMKAVALIGGGGMVQRVLFYIAGMLICAFGVALLFHTYIPPEAYELFVKEVSEKYGRDIHIVKTVYDISSCIISVIMSFIFFGFMHFEGVKLGTIICALLNGFLISKFTYFLNEIFDFKNAFRLKNVEE